MGKVTLGYYNLRGVCHPIKMMLEWLEIPYEMEYYYMGEGPEFDQSQWFDKKPVFGIDFANLPYFIDGDVKISESFAILRHIARANKIFYPETVEENMACDSAQGATLDVRTALIEVAYSKDHKTAKANYIRDFPKKLGNFERILAKRKWLAADRLMYVDFVFADCMDWLELMEPGCLKLLPNVQKYLQRFESLEAIAKHKQSDQYYSLPIMSRMATWGGQPLR